MCQSAHWIINEGGGDVSIRELSGRPEVEYVGKVCWSG